MISALPGSKAMSFGGALLPLVVRHTSTYDYRVGAGGASSIAADALGDRVLRPATGAEERGKRPSFFRLILMVRL